MNLATFLSDARNGLIDLSKSNPLLNYRSLKRRGLALSTLEPARLFQSVLDSSNQELITVPSTLVTSKYDDLELARRARYTQAEAKLFAEEKGVNVLYIAGVFLRWQEDERSDFYSEAPLILIPIRIQNIESTFVSVTRREEDIQDNFALIEKLKEQGIRLPLFQEGTSSLDNFLAELAEAIAAQPRWSIDVSRVAIDLFKCQKYIMYEDLKPENWPVNDEQLPDILRHAVNEKLFSGGDYEETPEEIDKIGGDDDPLLVLDADLTQLRVILQARKGGSFVVQGPPGTGKSQTITNLISDAVSLGKSVLFVAEKSTALEVVKSNLEKEGLGSLVLDLHSSESRKISLLQDISASLDKALTQDLTDSFNPAAYATIKTELNAYREALRQEIGEYSALYPQHVFSILAEALSELRIAKVPLSSFDAQKEIASNLSIPNLVQIRDDRNLLRSVSTYARSLGGISSSPVGKSVFPPGHIVDSVSIEKLCNEIVEVVRKHGEFGKNTSDNEAEIVSNLLREFGHEVLHLAKKFELWDERWKGKGPAIIRLQGQVTNLIHRKRTYSKVVKEAAWHSPSAELARVLDGITANPLYSLFNRKAISRLASELLTNAPKPKDPIGNLRAIRAFEIARRKLASDAELVDSHLAVLCAPANGDLAVIQRELKALAYQIEEINQGRLSFEALRGLSEESIEGVGKTSILESPTQTLESLATQLAAILCQESLSKVGIAEFCQLLLKSVDKLDDWIEFGKVYKDLEHRGLTWAFDQNDALPELAYLYVVFSNAKDKIFRERPILSKYSGTDIERLRKEFAELDKHRKRHSRLRILQTVKSRAQTLNSSPTEGFRILNKEFRKKRNVLSVRRLISSCSAEIRKIKPILMMSPLTVSSFVPRESEKFDFVVFDEASQIKPGDAIGAILRAKQAIIVGDSMQLPPTRAFDVDSSNEDAYIDYLDVDQGQAGADTIQNLESILDFAQSMRVPERKLNWHYRSKFNSLIRVSNKEFYRNELVIFPDAKKASPSEGLQFEYIENGNYDRSGTRRNMNEARVLAASVIDHIRTYPERSLGVGTFSLAQKEAIEECLFHEDTARSEVEAFNKLHGNEEFFVKNLETVQGDERDCMFISIGYGKSSDGLSRVISFGPLSQNGGDRRLNVLISRAKYQCRVFSSIRYHDIDTTGLANPGVAKLKTYLKYAETGEIDVPERTGESYESEFERFVGEAITSLGYEIHYQIGSAGFRVDIGVRDPRFPGSYLCGIECDGATYHRSLSARERDRIRQEILEMRGWKILRVWSTDWFSNKVHEINKLRDGLEALMGMQV